MGGHITLFSSNYSSYDGSSQKNLPDDKKKLIVKAVQNVLHVAEKYQLCSMNTLSHITIDMSRVMISSVFNYPFTVKHLVLGIIRVIVRYAKFFPSFYHANELKLKQAAHDPDTVITNYQNSTSGQLCASATIVIDLYFHIGHTNYLHAATHSSKSIINDDKHSQIGAKGDLWHVRTCTHSQNVLF